MASKGKKKQKQNQYKTSGLKILELKSEFSPKPLFYTPDLGLVRHRNTPGPAVSYQISPATLEITETKISI